MRKSLCIALSSLFMLACASQGTYTKQQKGTAIGAGTGAVVGGVIGGSVARKGHGTTGAIIGGLAGAALGGLVGNQIGAYMDRQEEALRQAMAATTAADQASIQRSQDVLTATFKSDMFFDFDSATLKPGAYAELDRVANGFQRLSADDDSDSRPHRQLGQGSLQHGAFGTPRQCRAGCAYSTRCRSGTSDDDRVRRITTSLEFRGHEPPGFPRDDPNTGVTYRYLSKKYPFSIQEKIRVRSREGTFPAPAFFQGSRHEIITQDCAGFWFVYKAHPPMHIGICVGGCNAVDEPKDKQDV